jgi:glycosyltransferase involved in cell wall biosynthesis
MPYKLSFLIPARREEFLAQTVKDILEHTTDQSEIIVVLDGEWAEPGIPQHPRVTVVYLQEAVGQRAATNIAAKLSKAKYVCKIDAHVSLDDNWDQKMFKAFEEVGDNVTMVSIMRNLWAFDWVCPDGHRRYQSPSGVCTECSKETIKDIVWIGKKSPQSTSYQFDKTLKFQYFGDYKKKQIGDIVETMSLQGSAFMLTREKYWELGICDENGGSWGHQGSEVALKTWLSGGRVVCNKKTWYAHMFRTQGGDFSFPWPHKEKDFEKTREYFRDIFLQDKWPKATKKLQWLIDKFDPPEWRK